MSVSAIIMAAGLSRRMKQNKLKMKINEKCIYEYIFEVISRCSDCFKEVVVAANDEDILKKARELGFKAVKNEISYLGQSTSIKLGIENTGKTEGYMFFTADQPFISEATIKELLESFEKFPNFIVVPSYKGTNGSPAIFPEIYKEQLLKLEEDTGGKYIIKDNQDKLIIVHINREDEHIDIDTMEDYEKFVIKKVIK